MRGISQAQVEMLERKYGYLKDQKSHWVVFKALPFQKAKEGWLSHRKHSSAIIHMVSCSPCSSLPPALRSRGPKYHLTDCSQTTCGQTFMFRHMQQNGQGREWSQSMPLRMWMSTGTNLSVTQSSPHINWWQKARPTSSAAPARGSGGWTKKYVISLALFLTGWAGSH